MATGNRPYINLTVRFLKLAIPVFGAVIAEYVPKEFPTEIKPKIDLMERFANSLAGELKLHDVLKVEPSGLTSAQGRGGTRLACHLEKCGSAF